MSSLEERVAVLESREDEHREFRRLVEESLKALLANSNEWAGVRKTLAAIAAIITFTSGIVGFALHEFWPHVANGKS